MGKYQAYPEYKDSGVEWLGEVPRHWGCFPLGALLEERGLLNRGPITENILSVMRDVGVIPYDEKGDVGNKKSDDIERYKVVMPGDLVVNSMNVIIGSVGVSKYEGALSPVYLVLKPRNPKKTDNDFIGFIFSVKTFQKGLKRLGYGILDHRLRIPMDNLKKEYLPVPDFDEQTQIAAFLDRETAKIDRLIAKQEALIDLLKEKRQAVISHAVTKGLDPDAPMKDSGVEWLGEIPAHWEVTKFRRVLRKLEQGWSPEAANRPSQDDEKGVLKLSAVKNGKFNPQENKTLDDDLDLEKGLFLSKGDLLLTRANTPALVGDACVVSAVPKGKLMLCDLIYRLSLENGLLDEYACYWLISYFGRVQIVMDARGSSMTMAKISQEHIKAWMLPIPPTDEQRAIAAYLDEKLEKVDAAIDVVGNSIKLLQERRTALISAAVTGKIDVREEKA
jgi:type I restriction enzyme S subunit